MWAFWVLGILSAWSYMSSACMEWVCWVLGAGCWMNALWSHFMLFLLVVMVLVCHVYRRLFVRVFVRSIVRSFVRSLDCSFVRSFVLSIVCLFVRSFDCSFVHSFVLIRPFVRSFVRCVPPEPITYSRSTMTFRFISLASRKILRRRMIFNESRPTTRVDRWVWYVRARARACVCVCVCVRTRVGVRARVMKREPCFVQTQSSSSSGVVDPTIMVEILLSCSCVYAQSRTGTRITSKGHGAEVAPQDTRLTQTKARLGTVWYQYLREELDWER